MLYIWEGGIHFYSSQGKHSLLQLSRRDDWGRHSMLQLARRDDWSITGWEKQVLNSYYWGYNGSPLIPRPRQEDPFNTTAWSLSTTLWHLGMNGSSWWPTSYPTVVPSYSWLMLLCLKGRSVVSWDQMHHRPVGLWLRLVLPLITLKGNIRSHHLSTPW